MRDELEVVGVEFQMGNGKSLKDLLRCGEIELAATVRNFKVAATLFISHLTVPI